MSGSPGEQFAAALVRRDHAALTAALHPEVDFKALTPGRLWEGSSARDVVETLLSGWLDETDQLDEVAAQEGEPVADTMRVGYRFRVTNADGTHLVEQQAYYRCIDGQIANLLVVCTGFRPLES